MTDLALPQPFFRFGGWQDALWRAACRRKNIAEANAQDARAADAQKFAAAETVAGAARLSGNG